MKDLITQIDRLIGEANHNSHPDRSNETSSAMQLAKARAIIASSKNFLRVVFGNSPNPYEEQLTSQNELIVLQPYNAHYCIKACAAILIALKNDIIAGLTGSIENQVTANNFDDFLEHAEAYYAEGKKMEAGVIASVVFEDTIKKISAKVGIEDTSKLENCISALKTGEHISKAKAASCRTAAAVRNSATHASWDEFDLPEVQQTIAVTRDLMEQFLES